MIAFIEDYPLEMCKWSGSKSTWGSGWGLVPETLVFCFSFRICFRILMVAEWKFEWLQKTFCNHYANVCWLQKTTATIKNFVPAHIMQILMVAEDHPPPSNGFRRPSATVKIRKQMRKPKQNTSVFYTRWGWRKIGFLVTRRGT